MTAVGALGATATLVALAFAGCTYERWLAGRRPHELAWTQALVLFALASAAYWSAGAVGWHDWNFRLFYLFGAIVNVPYLAVGTVYLLGGERVGRTTHRVVHLLAAFCAGAVLFAPMGALPRTGLPEGKEVFGPGPRVMAAVGSGVGATVLIVGALWSVWTLLRSRRRPAAGAAPSIAPGRLAVTNVMIAIGAFVLGLGGTFYTGNAAELAFGVFLVAGIAILFGGFLVSSKGAVAKERGPVAVPRDPFMAELYAIAHERSDRAS
jgi:hypothetical protein